MVSGVVVSMLRVWVVCWLLVVVLSPCTVHVLGCCVCTSKINEFCRLLVGCTVMCCGCVGAQVLVVSVIVCSGEVLCSESIACTVMLCSARFFCRSVLAGSLITA